MLKFCFVSDSLAVKHILFQKPKVQSLQFYIVCKYSICFVYTGVICKTLPGKSDTYAYMLRFREYVDKTVDTARLHGGYLNITQ
jgi:hypothetical protein